MKTIVVIGCGGTGSFLVEPLARYLNSINFNGRLILCDGDSYSPSNNTRQSFNSDGLGKNKAEYQARKLGDMFTELDISYVDEYLSKDDVGEFSDDTIFINCADNHAIRKYVEDYVATLSNGIHICCGNELTRGQVQISGRINGSVVGHSIYNKYPEFNTDAMDRSIMSCEELGNLPSGGQVITANMTAATFAMNYVVAIMTKTSPSYLPREVVFNTALNTSTPIYDDVEE